MTDNVKTKKANERIEYIWDNSSFHLLIFPIVSCDPYLHSVILHELET